MSNIESLTLWNDGVLLMEKKDYQNAISVFSTVPETSSKTWFNTAVCHIIIGGHRQALQAAEEALAKDEYLAVGYYLKGIVNFKLNRYEEATKDFSMAHTNLRGRKVIDYNQLGLKFKLFDYEPLYNAGVVWGHLGNRPKALDYLLQAQKSQNDLKRLNIDQVIAAVDKNQKVQLLQVPFAEMIFRPPKTKLANLKKKDYLGKAKVISALDVSDKSPGFEAPRKMSLGLLQIDPQAIKQSSAPSSPNFGRKNRRASEDGGPSAMDKGALLETAIGEAARKLKATGLQLPSQGMRTSKSDSNLSAQDLLEGSSTGRKNLPPPPNKPAPKLPGRTIATGASATVASSRSQKPLPVLLVEDSAAFGRPPNKPPPSLPSKANITAPPNKPAPSMPSKGNITPPPNKPPPSMPNKGNITAPPNKPPPSMPYKGNITPPPNKPPPTLPPGRQPFASPINGRTGNALPLKPGVQKIGSKEFNLNQKRNKPLPRLPPGEGGGVAEGENGDEELYLYAEETNQLAERIDKLRHLDRNRSGTQEEYTETDVTEDRCVKPSHLGKARSPWEEGNEERIKQRKPLPTPPKEGNMTGSHSSSSYRPPVINIPATTIAYNKPPKPPYSPKALVTVEINCNGSKLLKFKRGTSMAKLLSMACEEFVLEPGSIDLWYKRSTDDEFICVEDESEMTELWAGVKDKLSLWCYSKE